MVINDNTMITLYFKPIKIVKNILCFHYITCNSLILQCARMGDVKSCKILLSHMGGTVKKKINVRDEDNLTPLHYAARYNQLGVLKVLADNHAG